MQWWNVFIERDQTIFSNQKNWAFWIVTTVFTRGFRIGAEFLILTKNRLHCNVLNESTQKICPGPNLQILSPKLYTKYIEFNCGQYKLWIRYPKLTKGFFKQNKAMNLFNQRKSMKSNCILDFILYKVNMIHKTFDIRKF